MKKILVIEDERFVQDNIRRLLEAENFKVLVADNGAVGVQLAQAHTPDLILCDVMMPELDGYGVLSVLRQNPDIQLIPFIFLTAKADRSDLRQGMELGADDYLTKPFTRAELLAAIDCRLTKQQPIVQLQQKVQQCEQLNSQKDDCLSMVSHELRAPLTNMKTALDMLQGSITEEQQQLYLEILQSECARETELVNALLDLQRLEASAYALSITVLNLDDWLPQLIEPYQARAKSKQQTLKLNLEPDLPPLISDHASVERILAELLNNACKYTPAGGQISLNICRAFSSSKTTPDANSVLLFTVSNTAEIPANELPRIFEKFYRVSYPKLGKQEGTGLGLTLVQKLVEQLSGTILVSSQAGWTTFTVELPMNLESSQSNLPKSDDLPRPLATLVGELEKVGQGTGEDSL